MDCLRRWCASEASTPTRIVRSHPFTRDGNDSSPFVNNRISNTKYSVLTFLPLNLWQQFSQPMNKYFLLIACLQLWSSITPVAPITTWGPLLVIFAISGLKEAIDDMRRFANDRIANERLINVVRDGDMKHIHSEEIVVGDIVIISKDEEFPADLVLLKSSEAKTGSCYIQTSNLDGETNLKQRFTAHKDYTQQLRDSDFAQLQVSVECAHPNKNIYNFDSTLTLPHDWRTQIRKNPNASNDLSASQESHHTNSFPLTGDNLLLQATFLRNTDWIYGLVVYTGNETKIGMNKSKPHQKYTKLDTQINKVTIAVFAIQVCMIFIWGMVGFNIERHESNLSSDHPPTGEWFLMYHLSPSYWLTPLIIPLRFLLLASMMIPISLKVSLDLIKLYYSAIINWDLDLYDADRDLPAKATNTGIAENLGQVSYCLSDKTGTLTRNEMVLRQMTICADAADRDAKEKRYGNHRQSSRASSSAASSLHSNSWDQMESLPSNLSHSTSDASVSIYEDPTLIEDLRTQSPPLIRLLKFLALCNTVVPSWANDRRPASLNGLSASSSSSSFDVKPLDLSSSRRHPNANGPEPLFNGGSKANLNQYDDATHANGSTKRKSKPFSVNSNAAEDPSAESLLGGSHVTRGRLGDSTRHLQHDLASETHRPDRDDDGMTPSVSFAPSSLERPTSYGKSDQRYGAEACSIEYASASPDELSLVGFASNIGVRLLEKDGNLLRISIQPGLDSSVDDIDPSSIEEWKLLNVLDFSSDRKRMSVVLRPAHGNGPIQLFTKGADDVIFARLSHTSSSSAQAQGIRQALDSYAADGLRTLCFASRVVPPEEYDQWSRQICDAQLDIHDREKRLTDLYESLERDLDLIGCTGIEDALGELVPETIVELREAGVKVWMLTGDRFATALEISKSCGLYRERKGSMDPSAEATSSIMPGSPSGIPMHRTPAMGDILYSIQPSSSSSDIKASLENILAHTFPHDQARPERYCLILDGTCLSTLLTSALEAKFALVALSAVSVICARTTPSQKANMVTLVKKYSPVFGDNPSSEAIRAVLEYRDPLPTTNFLTKLWAPSSKVVLSIGDGGNDCAMILLADVGVGILGKEGLQAARASDFAIGKFHYLKKLLLVHGRYAYNRTAFVSQYCFFKSMLICLVQLFFAFLSAWSGASYFDSYSLVTYNLFYTSLPVMLYVFEKDLSERMLLLNPRLYATSRTNCNFTRRSLLGWLIRAVYQAIVLIAFAANAQHGAVAGEAFGPEAQVSNALAIYTACVIIHPITIYLESAFITRIHHYVLMGTVALFVATNCVLATMSPTMDMWHIYYTLLCDGEYYLRTLILTSICILPVLAWKFVQQRYYPSEIQLAHELDLKYSRPSDDSYNSVDSLHQPMLSPSASSSP